MQIFNAEHTFNHPWETIAEAAWRKYPNPINTAVIGTDVIERKVAQGILITHRLVSSVWLFPAWVETVIGSPNICYASELSEVDPVKREMVLKTRNISLSKYIDVKETLKYVPHPKDPKKTLLTHEARVSIQRMPLSNYLESLMTRCISSNASKGRQAIEWAISLKDSKVNDLKNNTVKSTSDELINQTKKSLGDFTNSAKKSMDDISSAAKESFSTFTNPPNQKLPKF